MPRNPNPKAKTPQIIIKPRANSPIEDEEKIRGAKEIVARNPELTMMNILDPFLKKHNWPPGNSQTLLETFGLELSLICFRCHKKFKHLRRVEYISGVVGYSCEECLRKDRLRRVVKNDRLGII